MARPQRQAFFSGNEPAVTRGRERERDTERDREERERESESESNEAFVERDREFALPLSQHALV